MYAPNDRDNKEKEMKKKIKKDRKEPELFGGKNSQEFWAEVHALRDRNEVWDFAYSLGCMLQELEARVRKLEKKK